MEESVATLEELVDAGKVRFIGVSNFTMEELKKAQAAIHKYAIVSNQVRYSLVDRTIERDLLSYCQKNRITVLAYSPLAGGIQNIARKDKNGVLPRIAAETATTEAQVALNWCIAKEGVIAITKSDPVHRIVEACSASGWRLSDDQLGMLDIGIKYRRRGRAESVLRQSARRIANWLGTRRPAILLPPSMPPASLTSLQALPPANDTGSVSQDGPRTVSVFSFLIFF
jgi:diketogulonate reductase-like aldo/keto reductase